MKKIYVFGDIHGELLKLENLFSKISINHNDTLIFLGDYVDRGPDSCGVIELLLNLNKEYPCVFIKGNHDHVFFYDVLFHGNDLNKTNMGYWKEGAKETLKSYRKAKINPEDHLESFYRLLLPFFVDDKKLFVHAGFNRSSPIHDQPDKSTFWWDRQLITDAEKGHSKQSLAKLNTADDFGTIYIGHTPVQNWGYSIPCKWTNVWNLDTGSGKYPSGRLSCLEVFSETIYQSDF
jgi:serine/threonine protein phosphatase 1